MRHLDSGRKLGVSAPHRKAMMRSLTLALIEKEQIKTTPARAKELRILADKVITLGKKGDLHAQRQLLKLLGTTRTSVIGKNRVRLALKRIKTELVPRFKSRRGGYTQMFRIGRRPGDNAELCVMQYIPADTKMPAKKRSGTKDKKAKQKAAPQDKGPQDKGKKTATPKKEMKAAPQDKPAKAKKSAPQDKPAGHKKKG